MPSVRATEVDQIRVDAVGERDEIRVVSPDRYRPDLATSLGNLGIWFSELGRPAAAGRCSRRSQEGPYTTGLMTVTRLCRIRAQSYRRR